jgi:hypothetical protein
MNNDRFRSIKSGIKSTGSGVHGRNLFYERRKLMNSSSGGIKICQLDARYGKTIPILFFVYSIPCESSMMNDVNE